LPFKQLYSNDVFVDIKLKLDILYEVICLALKNVGRDTPTIMGYAYELIPSRTTG